MKMKLTVYLRHRVGVQEQDVWRGEVRWYRIWETGSIEWHAVDTTEWHFYHAEQWLTATVEHLGHLWVFYAPVDGRMP